MNITDIVKKFLSLHDDQESQAEYFYNEVFSKHNLNAFRDELVRHLSDKVKKKYIYMVTFTLRDKKKYDKARDYIYRQHERIQLKVIEYHVVEELTKAGMPHWHVAIETEKPLKKNRFNYYSKLYGNIDLSRTKGQLIDSVLNYMSKSNTPEKLK